MKAIIASLILMATGNVWSRGVSIYNGEEKRFVDQDRQRVLSVLQSMGIPYRVSPDNLIIVPAAVQKDVKEIVAQGFRAQRQTYPTQPSDP